MPLINISGLSAILRIQPVEWVPYELQGLLSRPATRNWLNTWKWCLDGKMLVLHWTFCVLSLRRAFIFVISGDQRVLISLLNSSTYFLRMNIRFGFVPSIKGNSVPSHSMTTKNRRPLNMINHIHSNNGFKNFISPGLMKFVRDPFTYQDNQPCFGLLFFGLFFTMVRISFKQEICFPINTVFSPGQVGIFTQHLSI